MMSPPNARATASVDARSRPWSVPSMATFAELTVGTPGSTSACMGAAARLDPHGEAIGDRASVIEILRLSCARSVEIDDVEPFRSFGDELARGFERRRGDLLDRGEVAARHPDGAALVDVDGGINDHVGAEW